MNRFSRKVNIKMKNFIRLLIGSGENCADIRYATGISTPDDFLFFEFAGQKYALMSSLEIDRARNSAKPGVKIAAETDFGNSRISIISAIAANCRCNNFLVPENFPFGLAEKMKAAGLNVFPEEKNFFPEREFKDETEVSAITAAQRAAEAGFVRAVEVLKECDIHGEYIVFQNSILTSEKLRAEIDCAILRCGMLPTGTICAGGSQAAQPHNAGTGALKADAPIVIDIFPRSPESGYWGDLTRTVVRGKASDIVHRAYDAVFEAREYAKNLIRKGESGAVIHCAAKGILEKHHFLTGCNDSGQFGFFHGLGHGVGMEIHESPRLSPKAKTVLRGGEVVTVEPGLYYPEWGGIRLEDLVYLPHDGKAVCLTQAEDFLEIN